MANWVKYIAFPLIFSGVLTNIQAQKEVMKFNAWGHFHHGYILSHRSDLEVMVKGHTNIAEFSFAVQGNGKKEWHQKYGFPYYGLSLFYMDFSNPEHLGKGTALAAFYDFPLVKGDRLKLLFKLGLGPGYIEKVFHRKDNYQNGALSSHGNGFAHLNLHGAFIITKRIQTSFGVSISHFSNASYSKPNLGINIPALNFGLGYRFIEEERIPKKEKSAYVFDKKLNHDLLFSFFIKERNPIGGQKYPVVTLSYDASKRLTFKSRVCAGIDFMYNSSYKGVVSANDEVMETPVDIMQWGLKVGYYLELQDLSIYFNQGYYLYTNYVDEGSLYQRWGVKYFLNNKYIFNISMKTHFAVADYAELGIGYRF